jgi:hypothetical protein
MQRQLRIEVDRKCRYALLCCVAGEANRQNGSSDPALLHNNGPGAHDGLLKSADAAIAPPIRYPIRNIETKRPQTATLAPALNLSKPRSVRQDEAPHLCLTTSKRAAPRQVDVPRATRKANPHEVARPNRRNLCVSHRSCLALWLDLAACVLHRGASRTFGQSCRSDR